MTRMSHISITLLTEETNPTWRTSITSTKTRTNASKTETRYTNYITTSSLFMIKTPIGSYFKNLIKRNISLIVIPGWKSNTLDHSYNVQRDISPYWTNVFQPVREWTFINRTDIKLHTHPKTSIYEHNIMDQLNLWNMILRIELSKMLIW